MSGNKRAALRREERARIWAAAYGASYAMQIEDADARGPNAGLGSVLDDEEFRPSICERAATVADKAVADLKKWDAQKFKE